MKKIISIALIMLICCFCFCGCTTKKDVVGLWKVTEIGTRGDHWYYRIYDDGTYDGTPDVSIEPRDVGTKWTIKSDTIVLEGYMQNQDKIYTVSDGKLLGGSGKVIAEKVSDDPTITKIE